ncbi:MAG: translational GTPase TypA, partial [Clostridia bacterium]|nr:translational GTPase TypA [Clostridia bacterium]
VNKVDRPMARPQEVTNEMYDLLIDLGANDEQLDLPVIYASGRDGWATLDPAKPEKDLKVLFDVIIDNIPCPDVDPAGAFQMMVSNIDFNDYTGRMAVGKILRGAIHEKSPVSIVRRDGKVEKAKIIGIYTFDKLKKKAASFAEAGEIVCLTGMADIEIGDTVCDPEVPEGLPFVKIDEPVLSMFFSVSTSPFAGQDGTYVTSRHIRERLYRELESNISLKVEDTDSMDTLKVSGRGELHLSVLIENMRRQGYEFQVSRPTVITKEIDGELCEPYETLFIDCPDEFTGTVIDLVSRRKGELTQMAPTTAGYTRMEFSITSRGMIGLRAELLTAAKGNAVVNTEFEGYHPMKAGISARSRGSLIAWEDGVSTSYGMFNAQDRGTMFIDVQTSVYEGMIVGESNDSKDLVVNVCKKKHLTAIRSSGADEALRIVPPKQMSLEKCMEFIADDELLEVTPKNLRLRKKVLDTETRAKLKAKEKLNG